MLAASLLLAQQPVPHISDAERILTNYGLPTGLLLLVLYGAYKLMWFLANRHVASLDRRDVASEKQAAAFEELSKVVPTICKALPHPVCNYRVQQGEIPHVPTHPPVAALAAVSLMLLSSLFGPLAAQAQAQYAAPSSAPPSAQAARPAPVADD